MNFIQETFLSGK